ncbi:hypothetical protein G6011_00683 [Alternaria panax]|uniref:Carboxylic ester hydrolase n=1 Tax=Alternaria panax TaxID=48097 RepID=A0AAD4NUZ0_9PLEO|nr:hypothetical protein G6011_00683 [Alternaria panax]
MHSLAALSLWLYVSGSFLALSNTSSFENVNTENGRITGHRSPEVNEVWEYLGIPYAQPPLRDLRFAAPEKYKGNRTYVAANFFTAGVGTLRSEDCLTLNIWSKPTAKSAEAKKPVFVLFHGGRFAGGNTNTPFANGQYLANNEDIIVVSVNYRLNVFGFPGAPDADTNLGLRDQRLAVEWLQKNVAAFGGDAKKIVIAGQSSGGAAVDWWSYAYQENPIVHGLMSTSGNTFSFPMNSPERQRSNWDNITSLVGCGSSNDTLVCMRRQPWETLSKAVTKIAPSPGGSPVRSTPPFYPLVDNETVFGDYLSRSASGDFAKLPYFHGHNDHEQGYYVIPAFAQGRNVTEQQASQFLLESFICPVSYEARARVDAGVPTWVYRYYGDWDNTRLYPTSGAYHGTELHMILGGSADASGLPETQAQKDAVRLVQRAVAVFTEDPKEGLTNLGWPVFDAEIKSWGEIAVGNEAKVTFAKPRKYDAQCGNITLGALQGMS